MIFSTGFVKAQASYGYKANLANGMFLAYSGSDPTDADTAITTQTLLAEITLDGAAYTAETRPRWKITLAGAAGSVDTIKIGLIPILAAPVSFTVDLATTATAVVTAINNASTVPEFEATSDSDVVYIIGPISAGTSYNSVVCTTTATTMTATVAGDGTPSGSGGTAGVAAVAGLNWQFPPTNGILTKETTTWRDATAAASGTIGFLRWIADSGDDGTGASTTYRRIDFTVGTSGADVNGVLTTVAGTPCIINTLPFTMPSEGTPTT